VITLYHYPSSPCAAKVRAVLTEKELDWSSRIVDILEKENLDSNYLRLNPKGVVPTLIDTDHVITESTIIMEYLDTAYKQDSLKPESAYAQAMMRKWLKWVDEQLHPNWAGLGWTILIRPTWLRKSDGEVSTLLSKLIDPTRRERQERLLRLGYLAPEFKQSLSLLEKTMADMEVSLQQHPWLIGEKPTLADLAVLPYIISAEKFGIAEMMMARRPALSKWLEAWRKRPTYAATMPWDLDQTLVAEIRSNSREPWLSIRAAA
jgi:glutathione S-transferase